MAEPNTRPVDRLELPALLEELGKLSERLTTVLGEWSECTEERESWRHRAIAWERRARDAESALAQVRLWLDDPRHNLELLARVVRKLP